MNSLISQIFKNANSILDLVIPYLLLIRICSNKRIFSNALRNALIILNKLGENMDLNQSITPSKSEILGTKKIVGESMDSILELKEMDDIKLLSIMEILNTVSFSTLITGNLKVLTLLAIKMIQLTMHYKISKYVSTAFYLFAITLCRYRGKSSYDFGKLSLKLLE